MNWLTLVMPTAASDPAITSQQKVGLAIRNLKTVRSEGGGVVDGRRPSANPRGGSRNATTSNSATNTPGAASAKKALRHPYCWATQPPNSAPTRVPNGEPNRKMELAPARLGKGK